MKHQPTNDPIFLHFDAQMREFQEKRKQAAARGDLDKAKEYEAAERMAMNQRSQRGRRLGLYKTHESPFNSLQPRRL